MSQIVSTIFMLIVMAATVPAFGTVHVIDQAVIRGAGGFPYKITQPGDYQFDADITVPAGVDAIDVMVDHVTIDLNGFSILGPLTCTKDSNGIAVCPTGGKGVGIQSGNPTTEAPGALDLKIYNGSIHGMGSHGIFITGDGSIVEKVTTDGNGGDGMIVNGAVLSSASNANGSAGIFAVTVRDSSTVDNTGAGIILDGRGGIGTGNASSFNGGAGMVVPNGVATNNTITRNNGVGMQVRCPAVITANSIINNVGGTLTSDGEGTCVIVNNATLPQI